MKTSANEMITEKTDNGKGACWLDKNGQRPILVDLRKLKSVSNESCEIYSGDVAAALFTCAALPVGL